MKFAFDLWTYPDVRDNAQAILDRLKDGTMLCERRNPPSGGRVQRWVQSGMSE